VSSSGAKSLAINFISFPGISLLNPTHGCDESIAVDETLYGRARGSQIVIALIKNQCAL
jgi:hypothetical protein